MNKAKHIPQNQKSGLPKGAVGRSSDSVRLTEAGLRKFKLARADYNSGKIRRSNSEIARPFVPEGKRVRTPKDLWDTASTSKGTLKRFFEGGYIGYETAKNISGALGFELNEFHNSVEERCPGRTAAFKEPEADPEIEGSRDVNQAQLEVPLPSVDSQLTEPVVGLDQFQAGAKTEPNLLVEGRHRLQQFLLEQTSGLTSHLLLSNAGVRFSRRDLSIPFQVAKKERFPEYLHFPQRQDSLNLLEPNDREEIQSLTLEDFLKQLLKESEDRSSSALRIAIVGESGAGKTTFLHELAEKIFEPPFEPEFESLTNSIAIWVPLAGLKVPLEDYLTGDWLKQSLKQRRVSREAKDALESLFDRQQVWLLLDGLDEFPASSSDMPSLLRQLDGWISKAHIVLTCRPNLWAGTRNELDGFDIYQLLDFGQPAAAPDSGTLMDAFIEKWWADDPEALNEFRSELDRPANEQLKNLVKNLLLLTLLCHSWQSGQEPILPIKADLYRRFTKSIYAWKQPELHITDSQVEELNQTLAQLACKAIEENSQFWLNEDLINEVFQAKSELRQLAINIGWLKPVRVALKRNTEDTYAFSHSSFQEYFTSLAIDSRDFFLPSSHQNRPVADKNNPSQLDPYRVFDPRWKEVILFWLGRNERQIPAQEKEQLLLSIVRFDDGCENLFDRTQLFRLLEEGCREFEASSLSTITSTSGNKTDGPTVLLYDEWEKHRHPWQLADLSNLLEKLRKELTEFLGYWMHIEHSTPELPDPDSSTLSEFEFMARTVKAVFLEWDTGYRLYKENHEQVERLKQDRREEIEAIDQLKFSTSIKKLQDNEEPFVRGRIIKNLIKKAIDDSRAVSTFIKLAKDNPNLNFVRSITWILTQTKIGKKSVIKVMAALLAQYNDDFVKIAIADYFYDLVVYQSPSVQTLKLIIASSKQRHIEQDRKNRVCAYYFCEIIERCSSNMHYTEFYDAWHNANDILKNA